MEKALEGVSLIVCCYNSSARLPATLKHIAEQKVVNVPWEVIVVDNNSTDNTGAYARDFWVAHGPSAVSLHVVKEKRPGLSFARDAGIAKSIYETIIFCDDDNWLDPDYVQIASELTQGNESVGIIGGLNTGIADGELPTWFEDVQEAYACGPQADKDGEVERMYICGAGMVIRKQVFDALKAIKFQSQLTDRKGDELSSGGDSELSLVALMLGFKLVYSSRLRLKHYMEAKRLKWDYFVRMSLGHSRSGYKLQYYAHLLHGQKYESSWASELLRITKPLLNTRGIIIAYNFFRTKSQVSEKYRIDYMVTFEKWLCHLKMYDNYSEFTASLEKLKQSVKGFRLGKTDC